MFSYCNNCPVRYTDPDGHAIHLRKEIGTVGGGGDIALIVAIAALGKAIKTATEYTVDQLCKLYECVSSWLQDKAISSTDTHAAIASVTKSTDENFQYWEAQRVKGNVFIGRGLTFSEATMRVSLGMDIMCANQDAAHAIVVINGYWNAVGPEIHGDDSYFWHYHPNRHSHTHIWYKGGF